MITMNKAMAQDLVNSVMVDFQDRAIEAARIANKFKLYDVLVKLEADMVRTGLTKSEMQRIGDCFKEVRAELKLAGLVR